jgi:hypothetical protein
MQTRHPPGHASRVLFGTLAALVLLTAATACATSSPPITSAQFLPGWQAHSRPLFNQGPSHDVSRNRWYVPGNLPSGQYVVVQREGQVATLIEGHRFEVKPGAIADIYLFLEPGYHDVEAVPLADVPEAQKRFGLPGVTQ